MEDSANNPIQGATVVIDNASSAEVVNTTTDSNGEVVSGLVNFVLEGPDAGNISRNNHTPHSIDVSATGYISSIGTAVTSDSEKTVTIQLTAA